jgi:hypothetical protein
MKVNKKSESNFYPLLPLVFMISPNWASSLLLEDETSLFFHQNFLHVTFPSIKKEQGNIQRIRKKGKKNRVKTYIQSKHETSVFQLI